MKAPIAPAALCAAVRGNRRYILFNPIRAISDVTFLIFFQNHSTLYRVYNPIRAFLGTFFSPSYTPTVGWADPTPPLQDGVILPPHVGWGDPTTPCRINSNFFRFWKKSIFLNHAHMEFITRLGPFFFRYFFGIFFWSYTPSVGWADPTPPM